MRLCQEINDRIFSSWYDSTVHCVHEKKTVPCIRCHNSGKQRRILKKLNTNTEPLSCKQVTKFRQNRPTFATATASLLRSLNQSINQSSKQAKHISIVERDSSQLRKVAASPPTAIGYEGRKCCSPQRVRGGVLEILNTLHLLDLKFAS